MEQSAGQKHRSQYSANTGYTSVNHAGSGDKIKAKTPYESGYNPIAGQHITILPVFELSKSV